MADISALFEKIHKKGEFIHVKTLEEFKELVEVARDCGYLQVPYFVDLRVWNHGFRYILIQTSDFVMVKPNYTTTHEWSDIYAKNSSFEVWFQ